MTLLPDFYTIVSSEPVNETDLVMRIMLNPQHPIYKGHFPQQPVLPGVCLLQIIKECMEKAFNTSLQYKQIASCKFLSAINPQDTPELELSFTSKKNEAGAWLVQVEGASSKDVCIKLKAQLTGR